MAIPTSATFTLDIDQIINEAYARVGGESVTGEELRKARRKLNLILLDWNNRGLPLWAVERKVINMSAGAGRYVLPDDTVDIINAVIREASGTRYTASLSGDPFSATSGSPLVTISDPGHGAQINETVVITSATSVAGIDLASGSTYTIASLPSGDAIIIQGGSNATVTGAGGSSPTLAYTAYQDIPLGRLGRDDYIAIPNKGQTGKPSQYYVDRAVATPILYVYPCNDTTARQIVYWRKRRLADVTSLSENPDVPSRFLPALISALSYEVAFTRMGAPEELIARLKARYDEEYTEAFQEDRDRAPFSVRPQMRGYFA